MRDLSFSQRMQAGASPEELKKYYALSFSEYERIVSSLQEIRKKGGKK